MKGRPSKYPPQHKVRAVELVLETGRPIATVATELGLASKTLRKWVRQAEADAGLVDAPTSAERDELRRLRRANAELKRTNDLKLAEFDCRPGGRPEPAQVLMFVELHRQAFGVGPLLAATGEPVSTHYERVGRRPSARALS